MTTPQHRCVFVGNIPYDATEEQLIQICEEVGPVVSFRLVVDRESGKPKGYGFCEYRDEETAASARRNLQGYEINGRQLRVDYAENDKGVDRNREQGRGGPGLASNFDSQKQTGGPVSSGDPSLNQPIGLAVAAAAASVMAGALGDPQTSIMGQNQNAVQSQSSAGGNDPLTIHLASMSKSQLYEVLSDMKALIQQNQQQARQILVVNPQLPKALFQIQIMLGMVPLQMLPSFRQSSNPPQQMQTGQPDLLIQTGQQGQIHSGQNQMQPGQQTQMQVGQHGQIQMVQQSQPQNIPMQQLMQPPQHIPLQPQIQVIQQSQSQMLQPLQSMQPQSQGLNLPVQPQMQSPPRSVLMQTQVPPILSGQSQQPSIQPSLGIMHHPPLPQQPRPSLQSIPPSAQVQSQTTQSLGFQPPIAAHQLSSQVPFQSGSNPQTSLGIPFQKHSQPPPLPNQPPPQQPYQMGSGSSAGTVSHGGSDAICQGSAQSNLPSSAGILSTGPGSVIQGGRGSNFVQGLSSMGPDVSWSQVLPRSGGVQYSTVPSGMGEPVGTCGDLTTGMTAAGPANVEDGNARAYPSVVGGNVGMTAGSSDGGVGSRPTPSQGPNQIPVEGMPHPQQQASQGTQLPPELESALLQQVMSLTEEQINSLPPEQRQQVLQLQRMLR